MQRSTFRDLSKNKTTILDGAMGTLLQKEGMPKDQCPEYWAAENDDILISKQREYIDAGSDCVYTFTFGANSIKLAEFGLAGQSFELNKKLAQLSRKAAGDNCLVAGDIGPIGKFLQPLGDISFQQAVEVFKVQASGLLAGGVDLFVIETMIDLQEARAALVAVREICDLPICVTMTFDERGRTLTGTDPVTALITLQSLGADAVGCNCSVGPEAMLEVIRTMKPHARVPLLAKPNAGMPKLVDGNTLYEMAPDTFAAFAPQFLAAGANLLGGCCGTAPAYISGLAGQAGNKPTLPPLEQPIFAVSSARNTVFPDSTKETTLLSGKIEPDLQRLLTSLKEGQLSEVLGTSNMNQNGPSLLSLDFELPENFDRTLLEEVLVNLVSRVKLPLLINPRATGPDPAELLEVALRVNPGRAAVDLTNWPGATLGEVLKPVIKYGCLLAVSEGKSPELADALVAMGFKQSKAATTAATFLIFSLI